MNPYPSHNLFKNLSVSTVLSTRENSYLCTLDMEFIKKIASGIKGQATWLLVHILAALVAVYFRFSKDKEL